MISKISWLLALLSLAACSAHSPAPVEDREINARVRTPATQDSAGVQVYSLQNPAVRELTTQARQAEQKGDLALASAYLERAMRIQPRDPQLLQQMAEVKLQKRDYEQALNFAQRSFEIGPRVGEICSRNWRTIGVAREHLKDASGAREAEQRAAECKHTAPQGL